MQLTPPLHRRRPRQPLRRRSRTRHRRNRHIPPRSPQRLFSNTRSQLRNTHNRRIALPHKLPHTRQLIPRKPKSVPYNLLMHISLQLKQDLAHMRSARPVVKTALSLAHTLVVTTRVHADVRAHAVVESVFHTAQALLNRFVGDFERLGGDSAVVVFESDAVVAPDEGGAARAAACGYSRTAFARFGGLAGFGGEPVEGARGGGEGADCGW